MYWNGKIIPVKLLGGISPTYCNFVIGEMFRNSDSLFYFAPLQITPPPPPTNLCITARRQDRAGPAPSMCKPCALPQPPGPPCPSLLVLPKWNQWLKKADCRKMCIMWSHFIKNVYAYICAWRETRKEVHSVDLWVGAGMVFIFQFLLICIFLFPPTYVQFLL